MGTFNDGDSGSSIRTKINTAIQKTEGSSAISTIDVDGGAIDGVTLGTNSAVTEAQVDNININGNTISSTDTNGDVTIDPNGTGDVNVGNFKFDADQTVGAGQDNYVLTYDNSGGKISLEAAGGGGGGDPDLYRDNASSATTPVASGDNAVGIGSGSTASGTSAIAFGLSASSTGFQGAAFGSNAEATGVRATALSYSVAGGADSFAAGISNTASSYGSTSSESVALGKQAKASGTSSIAIGKLSVAGNGNQTVAIGELNEATGTNAFCLGSYDNTASGNYSLVLGTEDSQATGVLSVAIGSRAKSAEKGKIAYSSGRFAATGDSQGALFVLRADTTDATATVLTTDNAAAASTNQIVAASDTCITFHGTLVAMQNGAQAYGSWEIRGLLVNDGGTTTLANSSTTVIQNASSWGMALSADNTNNALAITCTGEASHNIRWVANISTSEVTYA